MKYQIINGLSTPYLDKLTQRFWNSVNKRDGADCWNWTAYCKPSGYGQFTVIKHHHRAHRVAYELTTGPIPKGLFVCHLCDNPPCVNPSHLFLATAKVNVRDMIQKGRATRQDGVHNGYAKLTEQQVREIRQRYIPFKYGCKRLAKEYGVHFATIHLIVTGQTWTGI